MASSNEGFEGSSIVPLGIMFTSYAIGRVKTFLHPLVRVIIDVLVVTTAAEVFSIWVVSLVCVLENSKTFLGALSRGFRTILVPVVGQISTFSFASLKTSSELAERDSLLVALVLSAMPNSEDTKAARTSGGREFHASKTDGERLAVGFKATSSLNLKCSRGIE